MGCWGITALESDDGLDAVGCIRYNLPKNGQLDLGEMLERLKKDQWNAPRDVKLGLSLIHIYSWSICSTPEIWMGTTHW